MWRMDIRYTTTTHVAALCSQSRFTFSGATFATEVDLALGGFGYGLGACYINMCKRRNRGRES